MANRAVSEAAPLLKDGRVFVVVGNDGGSGLSAELYDPRTGAFTQTSPMLIDSGYPAVALLGDGRVLIAIGEFAAAQLYDPKTGAFTLAGSTASSAGNKAISLADGRALVGGTGCAADACSYPEVFDPGSGNYCPAGKDGVESPYERAVMTLLKDGRVLFTGGYVEPDHALLFTP
jgi:hypothetical protein